MDGPIPVLLQPALPPAWPGTIELMDFKMAPFGKPKPIVEHLLDGASRMIFGGGSKTYKTWAMSDLGLSIAAGAPWLGFSTHQHCVLYVNFELKPYYMQQRLIAIGEAKKLCIAKDQFFVWNLRGYEVSLLLFKERLLEQIENHQVVIVFVDPFYKLLGSADERVSAELNPILATFDEINRLSGAAVVFAAHFTKGNQAAKDPMDRISGGGSISRDPDNVITLTNHEKEECFCLDFTLRDFPPVKPFVVEWKYPLLVRTDLDPKDLKQPGNVGRKQKMTVTELCTLVPPNDTISFTELFKRAQKAFDISQSVFAQRLKEAKQINALYQDASGLWGLTPELSQTL
jgi:hypothetical protein